MCKTDKTPHNADNCDPLLTTEHAAALLGVSVRTLRRMRSQPGAPPSIQYNARTWRYRRSALLAWLDAGGIKSRTASGNVHSNDAAHSDEMQNDAPTTQTQRVHRHAAGGSRIGSFDATCEHHQRHLPLPGA